MSHEPTCGTAAVSNVLAAFTGLCFSLELSAVCSLTHTWPTNASHQLTNH